MKQFKELMTEGISGPETYDRTVKGALKELEMRLKKDKTAYTVRPGYNMAWVDFGGQSVLIDGEKGRNKFKIYINKRPDMFYGKAEYVVNYLKNGMDVEKIFDE